MLPAWQARSSGAPFHARGLSDLLQGPHFAHLGIAPIGPALASTVASTYPVDPLTAALVFLGRHELGAPADRIATPFFFQIQRSDVVDASVGLRWRFSDNGDVALNALVPLNDDGLRAEVVPTLEVEYAFSAPW